MDRTPVTSSNITSIGYDTETQTLEVQFTSGAVYQYENVPPDVYQALMAADSIGSYFYYHVRKSFPYHPV